MATEAAALPRQEEAALEPGRWRSLIQDAFLHPHTRVYRVTMRFVLALILLSLVLLALETVESLHRPYQAVFDGLEYFILAAFTIEYVAHVYVAEDRRRYILSWWGIIDLLAILPSYLALLDIKGLKILRELRVLRVLRILKLMKVSAERYTKANAMLSQRRSTAALDIQIYFIALFTVVIIASTLAYNAEQAVADSKFTSIPAAMWWAFVTVTTTGYGDMIPQTLLGRLVAAGTMLSGLALFGMLTSVVGRQLLTTLFGSAPTDSGGEAQGGSPAAPAQAAAAVAAMGVRGMMGMAAAASAALAAAAPTAPVGHPPPSSGAAPPRGQRTGSFYRAAVGARAVHERSSVPARLAYAAFVDSTSRVFKVVNTLITVLILASVVQVVLESVQSVSESYGYILEAAEYVILAAFTLEYAAHIYLAENRRRYLLSFWGVIDLLAILPSYLALTAHLTALNLTDIRIVRTLRVLRVLRVLKLSKIAVDRAQQTMQRRENTFWLDLQIYLIALFTALIISSTLVYHAEHQVEGTPFADIPASMWWGIITITTTGYGDMVPVTVLGRVVAVATMITGLALFGILMSVIGRAMMSSLFGSTDGGTAGDTGADGPTDQPSAPAAPGDGDLQTSLASTPSRDSSPG